MQDLKLLVTLWPSFPHFDSFAHDERLGGIRLNSAMMNLTELDTELEEVQRLQAGGFSVPLWFDIKGRQPRVQTVETREVGGRRHMVLTLNHAIDVETPTPILFKAGEDFALLDHLEENGRVLVFEGGPSYMVLPGESLCIRHPSFKLCDDIINDYELEKIEKVKAAGFTRWYLSYVESQRDVDRFLELVGRDAQVGLKIETPRGLDYVAKEFQKRDNLQLVAACGDLFVEIDWPHKTLKAIKAILEADPDACAASRMLLSVSRNSHDTQMQIAEIDPRKYRGAKMSVVLSKVGSEEPEESMTFDPNGFDGAKLQLSIAREDGNATPDLCDFAQLAWLYDIGYRNMMLCDEICLKEHLLTTAVNAFDAFREEYVDSGSNGVEVKVKPKKKKGFFSSLFR